jgi:hypothetical protein
LRCRNRAALVAAFALAVSCWRASAIASLCAIASDALLASLFWWPVTKIVKRRFGSRKYDVPVIFSVASVTGLVKRPKASVDVRKRANSLFPGRLANFADALRFTARFSL